MKKIKTLTELICRLKSANININEFDYIEGKTKEEYISSHPFIHYGRRFYRNPVFLSILFDNNLRDEVEFIINMKEFNVDYNILAAFVMSKSKFTNKIFEKIVKQHFENINIETTIKENDMDNLMVDCAIAERLDYYKELEQIAITNNIKPKYEHYSNAGNGYCLYNACKIASPEFTMYLIKDADVTLNDSMAFAVACREGNYKIALELANHGIDIHTKKDLGLSMILRNERRGLELSLENFEAKEQLISLFSSEATTSEE